jgi:PAS domain S-box-containing protein
MSDPAPAEARSRFRLRYYALAGVLAWTALIAASLAWSIFEQDNDILDSARYQAQTNFQKELLLQFWMGGHLDSAAAKNKEPPNSDLTRAFENAAAYPAPMLRQILGPSSESAGVRSHLASLKPTWPENVADAWEAGAIREFAKGATEVASVATIEGREFMRVMRPLVTEASCQSCHGTKDYSVGEIRGGLSVAVPLAPLRAHAKGEFAVLVTVIGAIWLLGLGAIGLGTHRAHAHNVERAMAEAVLRDSEKRYHTLADSGQALVWTSGSDKKCDYFNQPWLAFTGRTLAQEVGDGWAEGIHPDDRARCLEYYANAFDRREGFSLVYRRRRHDGEFRWIQVNGSPRYDSRGNFVGYIGHCLDVTERKLAEDERERLIRELQATLAEVKTLSGLLPICSGCKKIRDDQGYWSMVEDYLGAHTGAQFTHGLCPECVNKYYPDIELP